MSSELLYWATSHVGSQPLSESLIGIRLKLGFLDASILVLRRRTPGVASAIHRMAAAGRKRVNYHTNNSFRRSNRSITRVVKETLVPWNEIRK